MKHLSFYAILMLSVFILMTGSAFGEGNIGVTFNQVVNELNWGIVGDYETQGNPVDFEIDGQFQSGDIYRGRYSIAATFDVPVVDLKILTDGTVKGYGVGDLGGDRNLVLAGTVPVGDLTIDIGVFGRNAGPFGSISALDILLDAGVNESKLDGLGLEAIGPDVPGLSIQLGNAFGAMVATEFDRWGVEIGLTGYFQLASEDEFRVHQLKVDFRTSRDVGKVKVTLGLDVVGQLYGSIVEYESALFGSFGIPF